jgi:regulation of enolase protein 1 (concanavalin A-like superfamily)
MNPFIGHSQEIRSSSKQHPKLIFVAWSEVAGYQPFRMAYLPGLIPLQAGVMCASPQGDGYEVVLGDDCVRTSV